MSAGAGEGPAAAPSPTPGAVGGSSSLLTPSLGLDITARDDQRPHEVLESKPEYAETHSVFFHEENRQLPLGYDSESDRDSTEEWVDGVDDAQQGLRKPKGPSGPRRQGEGVEDEEQEIICIDRLGNGIIQLRVTLLAAGFVIGASGSSVREISQVTGAVVQSWSEQASSRFRRPSRVFRIQGRKRAVQAAVEIIQEAVQRYKDLCASKRRGAFVQRQQCIRGVEFSYQPPPRTANLGPPLDRDPQEPIRRGGGVMRDHGGGIQTFTNSDYAALDPTGAALRVPYGVIPAGHVHHAAMPAGVGGVPMVLMPGPGGGGSVGVLPPDYAARAFPGGGPLVADPMGAHPHHVPAAARVAQQQLQLLQQQRQQLLQQQRQQLLQQQMELQMQHMSLARGVPPGMGIPTAVPFGMAPQRGGPGGAAGGAAAGPQASFQDLQQQQQALLQMQLRMLQQHNQHVMGAVGGGGGGGGVVIPGVGAPGGAGIPQAIPVAASSFAPAPAGADDAPAGILSRASSVGAPYGHLAPDDAGAGLGPAVSGGRTSDDDFQVSATLAPPPRRFAAPPQAQPASWGQQGFLPPHHLAAFGSGGGAAAGAAGRAFAPNAAQLFGSAVVAAGELRGLSDSFLPPSDFAGGGADEGVAQAFRGQQAPGRVSGARSASVRTEDVWLGLGQAGDLR